MIFWLIITLVTIVIALIAFSPLFREVVKGSGTKRDVLNKALYFDRLDELNEDEDQGLLENTQKVKIELQQSLLQDIPQQAKKTKNKQTFGKVWGISGVLIILIIATLSYLKVGSWQEQMMLEKTYQKLSDFNARLKDKTNPITNRELQQLMVALRLKLQKDPKNAEDWWKLGELAISQQNAQLAFDSFMRANQIDPENIKYKMSYARFLLFSKDKMEKMKGTQLLKEVLRVEHTNLQALSLLGFQYFESQDYEKAVTTWTMMLRLLPENDPKIGIIKQSIETAQKKLNQK